MKKLFIALFAATALLSFGVSCDSGANEPDAPIESGNPADSIPADTVPQVTPPDQKPQGLDSVLIPEGLELVDYTPYTGPVEPLSDQIRPLMTNGKVWTSILVYNNQERNSFNRLQVIGDREVGTLPCKIVRTNDDCEFEWEYYFEKDGLVKKKVPGDFLMVFDINPSESITFLTDAHPSYICTIISRGKMTLMGKERRAVKIWNGNRSVKAKYDYWVEGIGPLFCTHVKVDGAFSSCCFSTMPYAFLAQCIDENGQLIYDYRDFDPNLYEELEVLSDADQQATPGQLTHFARPTVDISETVYIFSE